MTDSNTPILTLEDVIRLKREVDDARDLLSRKEARLNAACLFLSEEAMSRIFGDTPLSKANGAHVAPAHSKLGKPPGGRRGRKEKPDTWQAAILAVLSESDRGIGHAKILDALKRSPVGNRVVRGTKGYYNAITRLVGRQKVERHGDLFYSATLAKKLRAQGVTLPTFDPAVSDEARNRANTSPALILRILRDEKRGLTGADLLERLALMPEATPSLLKHKQFIYTVLAKMLREGELIKEGPVYYLNVPQTTAVAAPDLLSARH